MEEKRHKKLDVNASNAFSDGVFDEKMRDFGKNDSEIMLKKLINWKQLSLMLSGTPYKVRSTQVPSSYIKRVRELIDCLKMWNIGVDKNEELKQLNRGLLRELKKHVPAQEREFSLQLLIDKSEKLNTTQE